MTPEDRSVNFRIVDDGPETGFEIVGDAGETDIVPVDEERSIVPTR